MEQPASLLLPEPALTFLEQIAGARARDAPGEPVTGSTNLIVRLQLADAAVAVRVPRPDTAHVAIDRRSECTAIAAAANAGLAPDALVCDAASGVLITRWVEGRLLMPQQTHEAEVIRLVASTLARLHALAAPAGVRSLAMKPLLRTYWQTVTERAAALASRLSSLHTRMMAQAQDLQGGALVLCHADLHHRNLIEARGLQLLDWEYAGLAEPYYDLASYSQSNDLTQGEREQLLEAYGAAPHQSERFALYCVLFDWVCVLWLAMVGAAERSAARERMELLIRRVKSSVESP